MEYEVAFLPACTELFDAFAIRRVEMAGSL